MHQRLSCTRVDRFLAPSFPRASCGILLYRSTWHGQIPSHVTDVQAAARTRSRRLGDFGQFTVVPLCSTAMHGSECGVACLFVSECLVLCVLVPAAGIDLCLRPEEYLCYYLACSAAAAAMCFQGWPGRAIPADRVLCGQCGVGVLQMILAARRSIWCAVQVYKTDGQKNLCLPASLASLIRGSHYLRASSENRTVNHASREKPGHSAACMRFAARSSASVCFCGCTYRSRSRAAAV